MGLQSMEGSFWILLFRVGVFGFVAPARKVEGVGRSNRKEGLHAPIVPCAHPFAPSDRALALAPGHARHMRGNG